MNETPRVLWINPWDKRIGPNRYLAEILAADRALAARAVVALGQEDAAAVEYRELGCAVEVWQDARLVHLTRTRENAARVLQTHTRGIQSARARMRALEPDAVITNSENVWFGGMAARALRIPHLQVFHALTLEHHRGNRPRLVRGYLEWLGLWNAKFIGVSQTVVNMLTRNGVPPGRTALVRNGLNLGALRAETGGAIPATLEARLGAGSPRVVTLGRISALKGHDLLVEALARVRETFPNVLWLCGGAVLSAEGVEDTDAFDAALKRRIRELGLTSNILFLDEIDYAPALIRRADVYVQPSRTESFGRAVVEALALGVPVAAFAAGALPEVLGEGALLAEPGNTNALADAIVCLIEDPAVRERTVARGRAQVEAFDVGHSVQALRKVLRDVVAERMA